jgi:tetratricopeptide (TPR) repeat protein
VLRERGSVEGLPETVQGLIAARVDLLEPEHKSLLQGAALVGKTFWLGAVAAIAGHERETIEKLLHALGEHERALGHLETALELVDGLAPSPAKASALGMAARLKMLASDDHEAIRLGRQALAMAEQLGLEELRAAALMTWAAHSWGSGRWKRGSPMWREQPMSRSPRTRRMSSCAKNNRASKLWDEGRLLESNRLLEDAGMMRSATGSRGSGSQSFAVTA